MNSLFARRSPAALVARCAFAAVLAFAALQAAYKNGRMMTVGPVQYTAAILLPALLGPFLFGLALHPVQAAGIAAVVIGVAGLLRTR